MSEIIIPEGMDLVRYVNEGYPICNKCGAIMDRDENDMYVCPACQWSIDPMDYRYDNGEEEEEWTDETIRAFGGIVPPAGCRACGGPYPHCKSSCKLFDD